MKKEKIRNADAIVLEADGKIDKKHGYGHLIVKRLAEFNISSCLISLVKDVDMLEELPPKPLIISGGMTEVTADVDWVVRVREFISKTIQFNQKAKKGKHTPIFGICFGAQLIAESYRKGSVIYLDDPEIGVTKITIDFPHPILSGYEKQFPAYTFHYNQIQNHEDFSVISLHPQDKNCFIQAFEIPHASCFGVQFHPEFVFEEFKRLLQTYSQLLKSLNQDAEKIIIRLPEIPKNSIILQNFLQFAKKG